MPELDAIVARRKLGFLSRISTSGSVVLQAAFEYDKNFLTTGLLYPLSVRLSAYGLSLESGDFSELVYCKSEVVERRLITRRVLLRSSMRSMASLSHLVSWDFDPVSFNWTRLYSLLDDFDCHITQRFISLFFGSFRASVCTEYQHDCPFCIRSFRDYVFLSTEHLLLDCPYFQSVIPGGINQFVTIGSQLDDVVKLYITVTTLADILFSHF
jgi:hypothetical protein